MLGRHALGRLAVDVGGDHVGAGARELLRVDLADALAAAGDDDDAARKVEAVVRHVSSLSLEHADATRIGEALPSRQGATHASH